MGRGGAVGGWFTARRSSTDVAALALGLGPSILGARDRLRRAAARASSRTLRLDREGRRSCGDPCEDLAAWPSDGWLVIDDYQEIFGAEDAEHLVAPSAAAAPIQLLIASRQRPSWVTARRILYDEVLELNQTTLAMDASEASKVLAGRSPPSASGLVALANGWPAVIGLASVTSAEIEDREQLPEALYRFFAEEVFEALDDEVKAGLATLAVAPILDRELATELLGERVESVCGAAIGVGVLVERGSEPRVASARSFIPRRPVRADWPRTRSTSQRHEMSRVLPSPTRLGRSVRRRGSQSPRRRTRVALSLKRSMNSYAPHGCRRLRAGVRIGQDRGP